MARSSWSAAPTALPTPTATRTPIFRCSTRREITLPEFLKAWEQQRASGAASRQAGRKPDVTTIRRSRASIWPRMSNYLVRRHPVLPRLSLEL